MLRSTESFLKYVIYPKFRLITAIRPILLYYTYLVPLGLGLQKLHESTDFCAHVQFMKLLFQRQFSNCAMVVLLYNSLKSFLIYTWTGMCMVCVNNSIV